MFVVQLNNTAYELKNKNRNCQIWRPYFAEASELAADSVHKSGCGSPCLATNKVVLFKWWISLIYIVPACFTCTWTCTQNSKKQMLYSVGNKGSGLNSETKARYHSVIISLEGLLNLIFRSLYIYFCDGSCHKICRTTKFKIVDGQIRLWPTRAKAKSGLASTAFGLLA